MSTKRIDFTKTVYELWCEEPAVADVLTELGFTDITKPGMLKTAGRFMTIPKGAALRHVDMERIREAFVRKGYEIEEGGH